MSRFSMSFPWELHGEGKATLDERQITHLIRARLKYDLYDFFRGVFYRAFYTRKEQEKGPKKHP